MSLFKMYLVDPSFAYRVTPLALLAVSIVAGIITGISSEMRAILISVILMIAVMLAGAYLHLSFYDQFNEPLAESGAVRWMRHDARILLIACFSSVFLGLLMRLILWAARRAESSPR